MEMIERYLQAVKFALPQGEREDIVKELRDSILSQIEEKEATLGRPLTEDEQAELLKKLGSPMQLASRYRKQQYLIGATMFPIYWRVLKVSLAMVFVILAAGSIATAAAGKTLSESLGVLFRFPGVALMTFAWMTVVFSALEFFGARLHLRDRWDPRLLPPLVKSEPRKSQFELIAQMIIQTLFGIWWLAGLHYQYLIFGPGIAVLRFGPVWQTIYPLFVVMVIVDLGSYCIKADLAAMDPGSASQPVGDERTRPGRALFSNWRNRLVGSPASRHRRNCNLWQRRLTLAST